MKWGLRSENARGPFYSLGLQVDKRKREVARAGVHAAEGSAAFPGLGPKELSGGHPRPCLGSTGTTAFSTPPARPEGCTGPAPWARLGFLAGRAPFRLHATETPRSQTPPGQEVLHHLLDLTSAPTAPPRVRRGRKTTQSPTPRPTER